MNRDEMDKFFEKMLGPDKGKGQGYRAGWVTCDIARATGGHLLTFHYKGEQMDYVRKFSLTEAQGKDVLPVLFPQVLKRTDVEQTLAERCLQLESSLTDAQAVADASVRYGARMLEERDRARKELEEAPNTPHPANRLYGAIVSAVEDFFPEGSRDLEWDVLPGSLRKKIQDLLAQLPEGMKHCTIVSERCKVGHASLRGTNWVMNACPWCKIKELESILAGKMAAPPDRKNYILFSDSPMQRLLDWNNNYHGEEGEPLHQDLREVTDMASELVEARKAYAGLEMGVEAGHLPGLIASLREEVKDLRDTAVSWKMETTTKGTTLTVSRAGITLAQLSVAVLPNQDLGTITDPDLCGND